MATLLAIYLRPGARIPTRSVGEAEAVADTGLRGDHAVGGKRQVTLLSQESWREACAEFGQDVDPATRRANLFFEGVDLRQSIGRTLEIGGEDGVLVDIVGETHPCELLDDAGRVGLYKTLKPNRRAGVFGTIQRGGTLRVGDTARLTP
ncbi:MAG: MOSC domain-containing protein [Planctomycetota bacterium]